MSKPEKPHTIPQSIRGLVTLFFISGVAAWVLLAGIYLFAPAANALFLSVVVVAAAPYLSLFVRAGLQLLAQGQAAFDDRFAWCAITSTGGAALAHLITPAIWYVYGMSAPMGATIKGFWLAIVASTLSFGLVFLPLIPIGLTWYLGNPARARRSKALSVSAAAAAWTVSAVIGYQAGMVA